MDGTITLAVRRPTAGHGASVVLSNIEKRFDSVGAVRGVAISVRASS
jgi:hypothetical protein